MATLHSVAGKAGAGKTTRAREIARTAPALLICEDEWLSRLAPSIDNLEQYLEQARKARSIIAPLCIELLKLDTSVVFDFAGNTPREREWVRSIAERAGADHQLHYIEADDETCRARVRERNASKPEGLFFGEVTEQQVDEVNRLFTPPTEAEGFSLTVYRV